MPATYMSYVIEPDDSPDEIRRKLYMGITSVGEQAYTLGAAIAELRKQVDAMDTQVRRLHADFDKYKKRLVEAAEHQGREAMADNKKEQSAGKYTPGPWEKAIVRNWVAEMEAKGYLASLPQEAAKPTEPQEDSHE